MGIGEVGDRDGGDRGAGQPGSWGAGAIVDCGRWAKTGDRGRETGDRAASSTGDKRMVFELDWFHRGVI